MSESGSFTWAKALRRLPLVLVTLLALAGCATASGSDDTRYVPGDSSVTYIQPSDRQPAPKVTGELINGQPWSLEENLGKVQALNVWASWCAPCRAEAPGLDEVANQLQDKGVQFIGLATRDNKAAAETFIQNFAVPYPIVWDPDGQIQLAFRDNLPPQAIPSTILIDKQGRIAGRILGKADRTVLRQMLTDLSNEPAPSAS